MKLLIMKFSPLPCYPVPIRPKYFRGFVCEYFVTKIRFHGQELLAPSPTPKLEDHPLSVVRDCLFNIFAATLHIGSRSSIRNLRTRHAAVTGTHLSHGVQLL
jgi:hypothetical protein